MEVNAVLVLKYEAGDNPEELPCQIPMSLRTPTFATARSLALLGGLILLFGLATPGVAIATPGEIVHFPLPAGSGPGGITTGPEGNLWFTESGSDRIGRITVTGKIREFPVPTPKSKPSEIITGPDGNLWFIEYGSEKIGRITPAGQITEFPIPPFAQTPSGITAGPGGDVWFTLAEEGAVGRISMQGEVELAHLNGPTIDARGITAGPDGNLWVAEEVGEPPGELRSGQIARITPGGAVTNFRIPTRNGGPVFAITPGPDGDLWFTGDNIGRITVNGQITVFRAPVRGEFDTIAAGPDGNLWFTSTGFEAAERAIGRVTPHGLTTLFPGKGYLGGITAGPDGNVWFTESTPEDESSIARITPGLPGVEIGSSTEYRVHRRHIRPEVSCSGGNPGTRCRGVVSLIQRRRIPGQGHKPSVEAINIGRAQYSLVSEQTGVVSIRLTKRALAELENHRTLRVQAGARATRGQGASRRLLIRR